MSWDWCGCSHNKDCLFCGGRGWRFDESPEDYANTSDDDEEKGEW